MRDKPDRCGAAADREHRGATWQTVKLGEAESFWNAQQTTIKHKKEERKKRLSFALHKNFMSGFVCGVKDGKCRPHL